MSTDTPKPDTDETAENREDVTVIPATPEEPALTPDAQDKPVEAEEPAEEAPAPAPAPGAVRRAKRAAKARWKAICLDGALVVLLLGVLGAAGYLLNDIMGRYHVPTPMELALEENEQLSKRCDELIDDALRADTQLHLRARLAQLETQAGSLSSKIADKKDSIDELHGRVLARQYAIRQADAANRSIAKGLLPGMPVGTVRTTTDKVYQNATIYRLDKKFIHIRFPEGQVKFPVKQLVKSDLPELARYAFGDLDLVDMSDFDVTEDSDAEKEKPKSSKSNKSNAASETKSKVEVNYDPVGTPVLDTDANKTTTSRVPYETDSTAPADSWDAPDGSLPL